MNLKEHFKTKLINLLSEEKAKKKSLYDQSYSALADLEALVMDAHNKMKESKDPRLAMQHKTLMNHFMDAHEHHMVGEYEQSIQLARRGIASSAIKHK